MQKFRIGITSLLLLSASVAGAEAFLQDELNWLKKVAAAAHQTAYSGTFIYQSGNNIETTRITHLPDGRDEYERLEGLDGERSEMIRKNDQMWCYLGERRVMVAKRNNSRIFPALLPDQFTLLQENYMLRAGEEERVAGLSARSMLFHPRDNMRYAHKIWAHAESGLLLKAVVLDDQGDIIQQYAFTQLKIGGDIERKWLEQSKSADTAAPGSEEAVVAAHSMPVESGWRVYALPAGFKKVAEVNRKMRDSKLPVLHMAYTDGLASVSVFIEQLGDRRGIRQGLHRNKEIQFFTRVVDDNILTVVGEVPAYTIMQIAESVRYGGKLK